jgi:Zn-dependent protease
MFRSINLGKLFGINVYVHPTFWILPLFVLLQGVGSGDPALEIGIDILFILTVFGCIILHEVGHALAARVYGIATRHITMYPIGGVAALERMPEKPSREIAIALAGPAVNLVIALGLLGGLLVSGSISNGPGTTLVTHNPFVPFAFQVMVANFVLLAFNLLPAFPMDGGRVLRALLAMRMSRLQATKAAVGVGTLVAIGMGLYGLLHTPIQVSWIAVAVVVYLLGQAELGMMRIRDSGRLIRERFEDSFASPEEEPVDVRSDGAPTPGFSGLAWDGTRRVWVEWKNGVQVGSIPPLR